MRRSRRLPLWLTIVTLLLVTPLLAAAPSGGVAGQRGARAHAAARPVVVVAAGDIACKPGSRKTRTRCHQMGTARLVVRLHPSVVLALGDLAYPAGTQPAFDHS